MKDQILVLRDNYKLIEWEEHLIKRCIQDNPSFNLDEIAEYLGISVRTLFRKIKEFKIDVDSEKNFLILEIFKKQTT